MNSKKILLFIERAENIIKDFLSIEKDNFTLNVLIECRDILKSLKNEITHNCTNIDIQVLKRSKILGVYAFKVFENSPLENIFDEILNLLWEEFPIYKDL